MKIGNLIVILQSPIVVTKTGNFWTEMKDALLEGALLKALKIYKENTGLGLKEAKANFDQVRHGICASFVDNDIDPTTGYNSPKGSKEFIRRLQKIKLN